MFQFNALRFYKNSFLLFPSFKFCYISLIYTLLGAGNGYTQSVSIDSIITEKKLKEIVYQIADDSLQGRFTNSIGCTKAANIIAGQMEAIGLKKVKGMDGYFHNLDSSYGFVTNVMGIIRGKGKTEENIIISAHYDHIGMADSLNMNFGSDKIFNGANDDASGVAVMLSLAEYFAAKPIERSILFVAFSGEEVGFLGSKGLSKQLVAGKIVVQINLEMLGRRDVYKRPFITGHWYSNLRNLLNQALNDTTGIKNYFETDLNNGHNMFRRSDNYPMALLGIPAHTIMLSTDNDRLYHTEADDAKTLDYKMMCAITKNIALAMEPLVQGKVTPERINPHKIR